MRRFFASVMVLSVVLSGCSNELDPANNGDDTGNNDNDNDDDTDGDTDGDTDDDTDPDTEDPTAVDCSADYSANVTTPGPQECVTEFLALDDTWVLGTVEGGNNFYTTYAVGTLQCNAGYPSDGDYSGPERIYLIEDVPPERRFYVELDSPCEDLRVAVIDTGNQSLDDCPVHGLCDGPLGSDVNDADSVVQVKSNTATYEQPRDYIVVIESYTGGDVGNFRVRAGFR